AEARFLRELLVHVQRIEIAEHSRAEDQMRLRNREAVGERIPDSYFVVPLAVKYHLLSRKKFGAPDTNRTCDLPLRRGLLYPLSYRGVNRRTLPEGPFDLLSSVHPLLTHT